MDFNSLAEKKILFKDETFEQEVGQLVTSAVEETFPVGAAYDFMKVGLWSDNICERVLSDLRKLPMPRKYIVTCHFIQKNGGGFAHSVSALWDPELDHSMTYRKTNDSMVCQCTVFCFPL